MNNPSNLNSPNRKPGAEQQQQGSCTPENTFKKRKSPAKSTPRKKTSRVM